MRAIAGREFVRMIERRGWQLLRISGSHHIYGKSGRIVRLSVPMHRRGAPCPRQRQRKLQVSRGHASLCPPYAR